MKISNIGYVTIKPLLGLAPILGVNTGKKRIRADGEVEAEFFCINKGSNCETIWATKDQIIINTSPVTPTP